MLDFIARGLSRLLLVKRQRRDNKPPNQDVPVTRGQENIGLPERIKNPERTQSDSNLTTASADKVADPSEVTTISVTSTTTTAPTSTGTTVDPRNTTTTNPSTNTSGLSPEVSAGGGNGGLAKGAKIGLGVGIPLLLLLIVAGAFFLWRRKQIASMMPGAHGKKDEEEEAKGGAFPEVSPTAELAASGASKGMTHPTPVLLQSSLTPLPPPPREDQHQHVGNQHIGQQFIGHAREEHVNRGSLPPPPPPPPLPPTPPPIDIDGVTRRLTLEEQIADRPVSPPLPEEVEDANGQPGSSGGAGDGSRPAFVIARLEDDKEMQWILEEERKVREMKEKEGGYK